jgi:hypothetical protein
MLMATGIYMWSSSNTVPAECAQENERVVVLPSSACMNSATPAPRAIGANGTAVRAKRQGINVGPEGSR